MKKRYPWLIALALAAVLCIGGVLWIRSGKEGASSYKTAQIRQGDLAETISATGTVEPEDLIDIGAQVAGRIVEFGRDTKGAQIDYGSEVKQGMLLARIDDSVYKAQAEQAGASLNSAVANLARARADLMQLQARSDQARNDWERAKKLGPSDALSKSTYEGYRSAALVAEAAVESGKAAIKQAEAGIIQAKADLSRARENLGYCTIPSPVDGVVIDRRVNIGQTVVASLNAPSLFLIAKDLKRVQVWVAVNEADIGNIHQGQKATFTVDAYPGGRFTGTVRKIRLNASMTQNVVTYTVEVATDNADGRLLPYLTANMQFETARADNALLVPNQALRWSPDAGSSGSPKLSRDSGTPGSPNEQGGEGTGMKARKRQSKDANTSRPEKGTIWVLEGETLRPVQVEPGISDGLDTAVSSPDIRAGMAVVTGIQTATELAQKKSTNPFMPQLPRGRRH
jgi:HlyD family secretion protein